MLRDLSQMFYPLSGAERRKWAAIVALPEQEYRSALEREAFARGLWDIVHMSKLTYLAHCNRVSGPGTGAEQPDDGDER